jgi:hypothetical protein
MMRALVLAMVLCAALAAPAAAKVWFLDMRGQTVRWDQRVTTAIAGCSASPGCGQIVGHRRMWMRRVKGHRLWSLGRIDDSGRLRFRVPHAAPGRYRLIAEADNGRHIQASESFGVTRAS